MTLKNVRKKRTTYRAVQWNGAKAESDEILALMDGTEGYCHFDFNNGARSYAYSYIYITDKRGKGHEETLSVGYWVVVSSKGKIEVLSSWEYADKYEDEEERG